MFFLRNALIVLLALTVLASCSSKPKEVDELNRALVAYQVTFQNVSNPMKELLRVQNELEVHYQLAKSYLSQDQSNAFQELLNLSKEHHKLLSHYGRSETEQLRLFQTREIIPQKITAASKLLAQYQ